MGFKRPGRDINHLSPPGAEIKNEWSYTSTPRTSLNDVEEENINFYKFVYPD